MSAATSRASLRVLVSVLLASNIAHAAALPQQALDPRTPVAETQKLPPVSIAVNAALNDDPDNVFEDIEDTLRSRNGLQVFRDFIARIFGWDSVEGVDSNGETTTVFVPPTSIITPIIPVVVGDSTTIDVIIAMTSSASSEPVITPIVLPLFSENAISEISTPEATPTPSADDDGIMSILPVGSMTTAINVTLPDPVFLSETTPAPSADDDGIMSILPVGSMTTAINLTLPDPIFLSSPEDEPSSVVLVLPPFPANLTAVSAPTLTAAVSPEEEPSLVILELPPFPANLTAISAPTLTAAVSPEEEPSSVILDLPPFPANSTAVSAPTLTAAVITGEFTAIPLISAILPVLNVTSTDILFVAETAVPVPISGTGDALVGTGINAQASGYAPPIWANTTIAIATPVLSIAEVLTGTAVSDAGSAIFTDIPLFPNATAVVPIVVSVTDGPATVLDLSVPIALNATEIVPTPVSGTGSPFSAADASFTLIADPLYPNTTYALPTAAPGTGIGASVAGTISIEAVLDTATPSFPNVTTITTSTTTTLFAGASDVATILPFFNDTDLDLDLDLDLSGLLSLRKLCQDPQIKVITLPLLDRFYGPNAYPSLLAFPGCVVSNSRQAIQAPGLLNCTALGVEVQRCQASGRKVLLSVKADGLESAEGNANFGDPDDDSSSFGSYFAPTGPVGATFDNVNDKEKRQIEVDVEVAPPPFLIFNSTVAPAPEASASTIAAPLDPVPVSPHVSHDTLAPTTPFPNLFDERHPPSSFALTLFSLFGEGHTERADLRPLGPDVSSPATPAVFNGTYWVNPPASILDLLERPLGEEVVVDGFDVQVPVQWKGAYQDDQFRDLVKRLRELNREAWRESGRVEGGPGDLGADGRGVVYFGWVGQLLKARKDALNRVGWVEWNGQ